MPTDRQGRDQELINSLANRKLKSVDTGSSVTQQELINDLLNFKLQSLETNAQVVQPTYHTPSIPLKEEQTSPTASDFDAEPVHHQLLVLTRQEPFKYDRKKLCRDIEALENVPRRNIFRSKYTTEEKLEIHKAWKDFMQTNRLEIFFFDFVEKHYESDQQVKVITKENWVKEDKTVVSSSHPPQETILISTANTQVPALPFKLPKEDTGVKPVIEQNNFTNQSLHVIGKQLDKIETKIDHLSIKPLSKELPLTSFRESPSLKTSTSVKIEQMLHKLEKDKSVRVINNPHGSETPSSIPDSEDESIDSIIQMEQAFQSLELKRLNVKRTNPTSLTKNWYPRPTPPDLQFEERNFQSQFTVSSDKLYEWNIDGLSEQELLNKLQHISMVANSYITNHDLTQTQIVDILVSGFTGMLHSWWEKHLTDESRNLIRNAVKQDEEGIPIFDEHLGRGVPDAVNTLLYTIIQHFIGIPSNITSRIHDQLSNLRCPTLSDFRWYKDVFMSRVMLRDDSNQPFWKEKFINGLPNLFAHKIRNTLINEDGIIPYNDLTYGHIISTIQKEGMKMCIDMKISRQAQSDKAIAKYELGTFCEQYGLPPIAPSNLKKKSTIFNRSKIFKSRPHYSNYRKGKYAKPNPFYENPRSKSWKGKRKSSGKFHSKDKSHKGKCYKCGKEGHYANKCKVKKTISQLKISEEEKLQLIQALELQNTDSSHSSEDDLGSTSSSSYQSASSKHSTPNIKLGCLDACCKNISVLTKQEKQEELLLELISNVEDTELKRFYLKKLKNLVCHEEVGTSQSHIQKPPISLSSTLAKFSKTKKEITISDLQKEINQIKEEIKLLKSDNHEIRKQITKANTPPTEELSSSSSSASHHESEDDTHSEQLVLNLLHKIRIQKWYSKVTIIIEDFRLETIALIDSGADLNCIQEGLIPTRYFHKSKEILSAANESPMEIKYELPKAHVCQNEVCFKTPFVIIKNLSDPVILGLPFIALLYPFKTHHNRITSKVLGQKVNFEFCLETDLKKLRHLQKDSTSRSLNIISNKTKHLQFLKDDIHHKRTEEQLKQEIVSQKNFKFEDQLIKEVCSDIPNAFWHRKQHIVKLPYIKEFNESKIPTKARPIQMSQEVMDFCKTEIQDLLNKGIIRKSKSPWSCPAFYVQKSAELERGSPRLVINYKPLNEVLE
ncbi:hypothetical protein EV1_021297 [Malus domestica]